MGGRIAAPFYVLYASSQIEVTGATLGLLSLAFLGADTIANLGWGYAGDKVGFRGTLVAAVALWVAATGLLLTAHTLPAILIAFVGLGAASSGYMMSSTTLVLEFGRREDMAMRIAMSSTAEGYDGSARAPCRRADRLRARLSGAVRHRDGHAGQRVVVADIPGPGTAQADQRRRAPRCSHESADRRL
jgi:hypothetical protein